jgi:hypothetical protein
MNRFFPEILVKIHLQMKTRLTPFMRYLVSFPILCFDFWWEVSETRSKATVITLPIQSAGRVIIRRLVG